MRKQWIVIAIAFITLLPPLVANMYGIERSQDLEGTWPIGPIIGVLVIAWFFCLSSSARIAVKRLQRLESTESQVLRRPAKGVSFTATQRLLL
jgi:hypothetical protein